MIIFAVIAIGLLVVGIFRLDQLFMKKPRASAGSRRSTRRFNNPERGLTDPDGRPSRKKR